MPTLEGLRAFYESTGGPWWFNNTGWFGAFTDNGTVVVASDAPCVDRWYGIVDCTADGRISQLIVLEENNMTGVISNPAIWADGQGFTSLAALWIEGNAGISSTLPSGLHVLLPELEILTLKALALEGPLASLLPLPPVLSSLNLHGNALTGEIPWSALFAPPSSPFLEILTLDYNALSSNFDALMDEMLLLPPLEWFAVNNNFLTGPVPWRALATLNGTLTQLGLQNNLLSGTLSCDGGLESLTMLKELGLGSNKLSGTIESCWSPDLALLHTLTLHKNDLSGPVSSDLADLPVLHNLLLHQNKFTQTIPSEFGRFQFLKNVIHSANVMTGTVPFTALFFVADGDPASRGLSPLMQTLETFAADGNLFEGPLEIPAFPSDQFAEAALEQLSLAGNSLTGEIPAGLFSIRALRVLELSYNKLEGQIPAEASCKQLQTLNLGHNAISGTAPLWITQFEALKVVHLNVNHLSCEPPRHWPLLENATRASSMELRLLTGNAFSCPIDPALRKYDKGGGGFVCFGTQQFSEAIGVAGVSIGILLAWLAAYSRVAKKPACEFFAPASAERSSSADPSSPRRRLRQKCSWSLWWSSEAKNAQAAQFVLFARFLVSSTRLVAGIVVVIGIVVVPSMLSTDDSFQCQQPAYRPSLAFKAGTASPERVVSTLLPVSLLLISCTVHWGWGQRRPSPSPWATIHCGNHPLRQPHSRQTTTSVDQQQQQQQQQRSSRIRSAALFFFCLVLSALPQVANVMVQQTENVSALAKQAMVFATALFKAGLSGFFLPQMSRRIHRPLPRANRLRGIDRTVVLMTALLVMNAIVIPVLVTLCFDERCLFDLIPFGWSPGTSFPITIRTTFAFNSVRDYTYSFDYPTELKPDCGGAVIQIYTPLVATSILLQGVLQPLVWLALVLVMGDDNHGPSSSPTNSRWRRFVRFVTPALIWPPTPLEDTSDVLLDEFGDKQTDVDAHNTTTLPLQPHVDMMYAKTCMIVAIVLSFGITSPLVAMVGLFAMITTSATYLHFLGMRIALVDDDSDEGHGKLALVGGLAPPSPVVCNGGEKGVMENDFNTAGLPLASTALVALGASSFIGVVLGISFQTPGPWFAGLVVLAVATAATLLMMVVLRWLVARHNTRRRRRGHDANTTTTSSTDDDDNKELLLKRDGNER